MKQPKMGGNTFENTSRVPTTLINTIVGEVMNLIPSEQVARYKYTKSVDEKVDHGDIDIVIEHVGGVDTINAIETIMRAQFPQVKRQKTSDGAMINMKYVGEHVDEHVDEHTGDDAPVFYQVDLHFTQTGMDMILFRDNYSLTGRILGKILSHCNLLFNEKGVFFEVSPDYVYYRAKKDPTLSKLITHENGYKKFTKKTIRKTVTIAGNIEEKICTQPITTSKTIDVKTGDELQHESKKRHTLIRIMKTPQEICTFLRLDYDRWTQGFETWQDYLDWIFAPGVHVKVGETFNKYKDLFETYYASVDPSYSRMMGYTESLSLINDYLIDTKIEDRIDAIINDMILKLN